MFNAMRIWLGALGIVLLIGVGTTAITFGDEEEDEEEKIEKAKDPLSAAVFGGMKFRSIGPAFMAGRIGDLAVDPSDPSEDQPHVE